MKIQKINLKDKEIRESYSKKLQSFEDEFSYPLGEKHFKISHGKNGDYFSFFDKMGEANYFVAEDNDKIVGAGCAVLRTSENNQKYWYLCDFKITKEYRKKNILEKMLAKYFFQSIIKSHRVVAVNMNSKPIEENGLIRKVQKMFWFLNIDVQWLNLHQWTKKELIEEKININNVYTNIGDKDIMIDDSQWQLYHMVDSSNKMSNFKKIAVNNLSEQSSVMCSVLAKNDKFSKNSLSGTGVIISSGMKNVKISSLEI